MDDSSISKVVTTHYDNGKLKTKCVYTSDDCWSEMEYYNSCDDNGQQQLESECYYVNAEPKVGYAEPKVGCVEQHGLHQGWYPNGDIWFKRQFVNGESHGIHQVWYQKSHDNINSNNDDGESQLKWQCYYDNGMLVGKHEQWYPSGKLWEVGYYKNGYRSGTWIEYNQDGSYHKGPYDEDLKHGLWFSYNINNYIILTTSYYDGQIISRYCE